MRGEGLQMVVCISDLPVLVRKEIEDSKNTIKSITTQYCDMGIEVLASGVDEKGRPFCKVSFYPKSLFKWMSNL